MATNISDKIKNQLIKELQRPTPDLGKVQELSYQLSNLDPNSVGFSVDAGIIERIGRELVAKQETAVAELVKNSYDADATNAELIFFDTYKPGGTLWVTDDGVGMNREEILNGFMRISSTDKLHNPKSPIYDRQRAGSKGIGRFAVQRLGHKLTIITKQDNQKKALNVQINWDDFQIDRELFSIRNRIEETEAEFERGTKLIIENLRESWSEAQIRRVYRHIVDLIQPFPLSDERKALENKQDPGFHADFYKFVKGEAVNVIDEETYIYDYALAIIEGRVDKEGQGYYSLTSNKLDLSEKNIKIGVRQSEPSIKFKELRNIHLKAYYYIYDPSLIPAQQLSRIRRLADEKGGIRLYRNGIRVLPYGEYYDDWLKLDYSYRRRVVLPAHGNFNFFGFVEVNTPESTKFIETSSREGLLENEVFRELTDFVHRVLIAAVLKVAEERGRKPTASYKRRESDQSASDRIKLATEKLRNIASQIGKEISISDSINLKESLTINRESIEEVREGLETTAEEINLQLRENQFLRVLGSLGLIIGEFTHEIRMFLTSLEASAQYLMNETHQHQHIREVIEEINQNFQSLKTYASYFDSTIAQNVNRELKPIEIRDVIHQFEEISKTSMQRAGITFIEPKIDGYNLFTKPMHPSEWSSIIFNLYTNSKKAIKRVRKPGAIFIRAGEHDDMIFLEFADNGDGIPDKYKDRIFNAFFTTTSPPHPMSDNYDDILGSGLGLTIVKDIIDSYDGHITLVNPPKGYSTCFRIEIPKATEKEVKEYGL